LAIHVKIRPAAAFFDRAGCPDRMIRRSRNVSKAKNVAKVSTVKKCYCCSGSTEKA
jgi:hypothetical protein